MDAPRDNARVNNRWRLTRLLGEGADATTWAAVDERDGSEVALKALRRLEAEAHDRFRCEFAALAALDHPNLVRVFDLDQAGPLGPLAPGRLFFTCELLKGASPAETLPRLASHARARALAQLLAEVASALDALHRGGLVHHDVKPANLLVDELGRTRLADLGLVAARGLSGGLRGTPSYLAPEAFGAPGDARVDLYALGATAYELWLGQPLRPSIPLAELLVTAARVAPRIDQLADPAPTRLADLIARLLSPDPRDRPSSARAVMEEAVRLGARLDGTLLDPPSKKWLSRPLFVGRQREMERALAALERANLIVIEGAAGSGRSRFVEELRRASQLAAAAAGRPALAWHGTTVEAALRTLGAGTAEADPRLRAGVLCDRLARDRAVLHLEVAPRVDSLARELVTLARHGAAAPSVVIVEVLSGEAPGEADERISLDPLDEVAMAHLCASMLGESDPRLARAVHRASGGEPRRAVEVIRGATARARPGASPTAADIAALEGADVVSLVRSSLRALTPEARAAAEALAVIGRPAPLAQVAALLEKERSDASRIYRALNQAALAGVVEWTDSLLGFPSRAHAAAAYQQSSPRRRLALHRRALALASPARWARFDRARHLLVIGPAKAAAQAALDAGREAALALDFTRAEAAFADVVRLARGRLSQEARIELGEARIGRADYTGALEAAGPVTRASDQLLRARASLTCARALQRTGDHRAAETRLRAILDETPGDDLRMAVEARGLLGRVLVARGAYQEAVSVCAPVKQATETAALDEARGLALLYLGRYPQADAAFQRVERQAGEVTTKLARARSLRGMVAQARKDLDGAGAAYRDALRLARLACDLHGGAVYAANLGAVLREQAEYADALAPTEEAARDLGRLGKRVEQAGALFNYGNLLLSIGDADGAAAAAGQALDLAEREQAPREIGYARLLKGDLARRRGRPAEAVELYRAALSALAGGAPRERAVAGLNLAEALAEAGQAPEARRALAEADPGGLVDSAPLTSVRVALELGDPIDPASREALTALRDRAVQARLRDLHFRAELLLARIQIHDGHAGRARTHLEHAHAAWEEIRMRTPEFHRSTAEQDPDAERLRRLLSVSPTPSSDERQPTPTSQTAEPWRRLLAINKRLNSELRLPRLLELILDTVIELTNAERGFLLLSNDRGELRAQVVRNIDQESIEDDTAFSRSIAERAAREGVPIVTLDASGDQRFEAALSVSHLKLRSVLAVPLLVKGKTVGCIYADHRLRAGAFGDADVALVCDLAEQAAIAIENARLLAENQRRREEIAQLNRELEEKVASQAVELGELHKEVRSSRQALAVRYNYDNLVGRTPRMLELFRLLDRVTDTALPVVIYGESGTGKELVARAIHHNGPRRNRPFVSESCAAIPETLLEAALFGHVKGAFTGADSERRGLFEVASGGTLFLDEVSEMSPAMQGKLLRVLQSGEFRRVGGERIVHVDVRVLVASNRDLKRMVEEGRFREDLFYRLNVVRVALPPLRERQADIPLLVEHFLAKHAVESGRPKRIARGALARLVGHLWPGNVRELENEVLRAAALGGEIISVEDLSPHVAAGEPEAVIDSPDDLTLKSRVERLERTLLREALARASGNLSQASRLLGLSRFGLQKKLKRYRLNP